MCPWRLRAEGKGKGEGGREGERHVNLAHCVHNHKFTFSQHEGTPVHSVTNLPEPLGTMVDGIHGRDVGKEGLGSADVAGGLFLADVLFPRLETETVGGHV